MATATDEADSPSAIAPAPGFPGAAQLIARARQASGLHDFGPSDFREGLDRLIEGVTREIMLDEPALARVEAETHRRLVNRLRIEDWYRRHPEIAADGVGRVTSITGLPRTGTSALANMLSLDDQFRCLRSWEQAEPVPPPVKGCEEADPRRRAAIERSAQIHRDLPEFAAMHLSDIDATEEDLDLLGLSFRAQQAVLPMFGYHRWWRDCDMRETFRYHRRVVNLLQSRCPPGNWLFKSPAHNFHLDALFDAYPDARVIMTHRDPAKVIPSAVSIMSTLLPRGVPVDPAALARHHAEHFRIGTERAIAARARIGEDRFLDIHHHAFVADPFGTIERVYAFLGRELRSGTLAVMKTWHARNRSGAYGKHSYTAEQFGLSPDWLRAEFAPYMERFDIRIER